MLRVNTYRHIRLHRNGTPCDVKCFLHRVPGSDAGVEGLGEPQGGEVSDAIRGSDANDVFNARSDELVASPARVAGGNDNQFHAALGLR